MSFLLGSDHHQCWSVWFQCVIETELFSENKCPRVWPPSCVLVWSCTYWGHLHCSPGRSQARLGSAQAGCRMVQLHLQSGPDLKQRFYAIITPNASSVCITSAVKLCVPDSRWRVVFNHTPELSWVWLTWVPGQPSVWAECGLPEFQDSQVYELSVAHLSSRTAKCKHTILYSAQKVLLV